MVFEIREKLLTPPCHLYSSQKLRIKALRGEPKEGPLVAPNNLHQILGAYLSDRPKDSLPPMIVSGDRQGPVAKELIILLEKPSGSAGGLHGISPLIHGGSDAEKPLSR
jgi:hypothetical protein